MAHGARLPALNADVGEDRVAIADGAQAALLDLVDWANVACGAHAGDAMTIDATVRQCVARAVHVGAHPGIPDRAGFGRDASAIDLATLIVSVREQVARIDEAVRRVGATLEHVKPHGALYHAMSDDDALAMALVEATDDATRGAAWVLRARSAGLLRLREAGRKVFAEGFVDRRYGDDGRLVPRSAERALIIVPAEAAEQAQRLVHAGGIDTLCVHGDHPQALDIAKAVRGALRGRSTS